MKKYIYKIINTINNKVYIGQTKNTKNRWQQHKSTLKHNRHENPYLQNSWNKYGEENFQFEIIVFTENYNEEEKKYIKLYNSTDPKFGYNIMQGGENPPILKGEDSLLSSHTYEEINKLKYDLKYSSLNNTELAEKYHYDNCSSINRINTGAMWKDEKEHYPLRDSYLSTEKLDYIIKQLLNTEKSQKEIATELELSRSTITMINIGENNRRSDLEYPIRKTNTIKIKKEKLDKEIIKYILNHKELNFNDISNIFKLCPSVISTINTGKYHKYEGYLYPIRLIK